MSRLPALQDLRVSAHRSEASTHMYDIMGHGWSNDGYPFFFPRAVDEDAKSPKAKRIMTFNCPLGEKKPILQSELFNAQVATAHDIHSSNNIDESISEIREFNSRLNILAQEGDYRGAEFLIQQAEVGMLHLDKPVNCRSYSILLKAYCKANRIDLAEALVAKMKTLDKSKQPNRFTSNTLLNGYVRKLNIRMAENIFREMTESSDPEQQPDQVTFSTIIKGYCNIGDMTKAQKLFDALRKTDIVPNHVTCNTMVKGFASVGDMDRAEALYTAMKEQKESLSKPDKVTCNTMVDGFAKNSLMHKAESMFDEMKASKDKALRPNQVTLNTMIDGYTKNGNMSKAEEMFSMLSSGSSRIKPSSVTYGTMIHGYIKMEMYEKAEKLFQMLKKSKDRACRPNHVTYTSMIGMYTKHGEMAKAKQLCAELNEQIHAGHIVGPEAYSSTFDGTYSGATDPEVPSSPATAKKALSFKSLIDDLKNSAPETDAKSYSVAAASHTAKMIPST